VADLSDQIQQAAADPASVSSDGQSVSTRPVDQLVTADQYLAAKVEVKKRRRGVTFSKLVPPGALPDCGKAATFDRPGGL
jgi:hypothetical protein